MAVFLSLLKNTLTSVKRIEELKIEETEENRVINGIPWCSL